MDPKHQFAAQYVLSRAAAERREREILASSSLGMEVPPSLETPGDQIDSKRSEETIVTIHIRFSCPGAGLGVLGSQTGGPQNLQQPPMCPSPSAHSDSSSGNGRLSSAGSEPGTLPRSCSSSSCKRSSGMIVRVPVITIIS